MLRQGRVLPRRLELILLAECCVYLVEHRRTRLEVFLAELVERHRVVVEVGVEVFGVGRQVKKAGEDLALDGGLGDLVLSADAVGGVVAGAQFAQLDFTQSNQRCTKLHRQLPGITERLS